MTEWFIIKNLEEFTDKARAIVFNNFGKWEGVDKIDEMMDAVKDSEKEELDRVLSYEESLVIVKQSARKQTNKKTNKTRYILNEKLFTTIVEDLNSRMVSNILNELVKKGLVESAYDSESNDFIFWIKDDKDTKNQK
jgi:hypothetical protein